MSKQVYIICLAIILSISFVHSISFINNQNDDENQLSNQDETQLSNQDETKLSNQDETKLSNQDETSSFTRSQRRLQHEMLQAHNTYRARHCAPPLRLDDQLSRSAQFYAEQLAHTNGMSQGDTRGAGQNIFTKSSTDYLGSIDGREPIDAWYKGIRYYDFNQGTFSMETGSFTQLVWANSRQLGIGIAYTNDGHSAYIVAQYLPPGNYGNEYQENVSPAQC